MQCRGDTDSLEGVEHAQTVPPHKAVSCPHSSVLERLPDEKKVWLHVHQAGTVGEGMGVSGEGREGKERTKEERGGREGRKEGRKGEDEGRGGREGGDKGRESRG